MKSTTLYGHAAGVAALVLSLALAGCGAGTKTEANSTTTATAATSSIAASATGSAQAESTKPSPAGWPTVTLPELQSWSADPETLNADAASTDSADVAAIQYGKAPDNAAISVTLFNSATGDPNDANKAAQEMAEETLLDGCVSQGPAEPSTISGFSGFKNFETCEQKNLIAARIAIAVPGDNGGGSVILINGTASSTQATALAEAMDRIESEATITR